MKKQAFTLVELIVVITILAILATVGFVSFSGYLVGTRDGNRLAQLKSISDGLNLYSTRKSLPIPDDKVDIRVNGETIAYQGYVGANVLETIEYSEKGLDPKDGTYFSYYLTKDKRFFQLLTFLEEPNEDVFGQAKIPLESMFANDYIERYPKVQGSKLGILTDQNNIPIQENPLIISNGYLDIVTTSDVYSGYLDDTTVITGTGNVLSGLSHDANCNRVKVFQGIRDSGDYTINPTGDEEMQAFCNMDLGGGGWTLIATTADDDTMTWSYNNRLNLSDDTTIGSLSSKMNDFKSKAYSQVLFKDMMFEDKQGEWGAYDNINPSYNKTVAHWMPTTYECAFGTGRVHYLTSGSIAIRKGTDDTQQDRGLFFTVYDNEGGCAPGYTGAGTWKQHGYGPAWGYRQNGGLSPDDPGFMGWGASSGQDGVLTTSEHKAGEHGDAKLGLKTETRNETDDGDYIYWYVR